MVEQDENPGMFWLFFSPSGRLGRLPYGLAILFWMVLPGVAISQMMANEHNDPALALWTLALVIVSLMSVVSFFMLSVKRVHDMGFAGIFALLTFVPVVSFFAVVAFLFWPSPGPNEFGNSTNRPK
ncbi:DUF805 domain-containing protein [Rhizobium sp. KVB221]|uniref:DUF805 domain-containing protein n=1 Tax=Rhizobium setariae TaxID=2801340 RepID=A0A936YQA5_9HYPH|nr:DUF805 domain-containing protein [Rhizobium setariae]MBL0370425.1 DUF805 domain-containing protein [Rhizobium setariae]